MVRAEQTRIQDAMADAERRLSPAERAFPVVIDRTTMAGVESALRGELSICGNDEGRVSIADMEGISLLDLYGKFWNGHRAQLADGNPRAVTLYEREIAYISGLYSNSHVALTKEQKQALGGFKSASDEAIGKDQKKEEKNKGEKRSTSAWFDLR